MSRDPQRSEEPERRPADRTAADVCAVLLELGRAAKGWRFYDATHPARGELLDRLLRVLAGELDRNGPLSLEVRGTTFWLEGSEIAVGAGRLDELARALVACGTPSLGFGPELDADSVAGLLEALAGGPGSRARASDPVEAPPPAPSQPEADTTDACAPDPAAAAGPPRETETIASENPELGAAPAPDPFEPLQAAASEDDLDERAETAAASEAPAAGGPALAASALLDEAPALEVDARVDESDDPRLDALHERLEELAECGHEAIYRDLAREIGFATRSLVEEGFLEAGHHVLRLLAAHAGDEAKRSYAERESAAEALRMLARGALLDDLVRRACEDRGDACLQATSVLREIGSEAVPSLLDRLDTEMDSERRARLTGVLLALGEDAVPALADAIDGATPREKRLALKLAGETQNPRLVPNLRGALLEGEEEVAREAALALVRVADVSSLEALTEALGSPREEVAAVAAHALGSSGRVLAVAPLAQALRDACAAERLAFARHVVRALGRLGRPEAVAALAETLARGGLFGRRRWRDLKLAAVSALASIPGSSSNAALARAARGGDGAVRQTASLALRRHTRERAG